MIKVLAFGDAGVPTGFERVTRGILGALHNTGRFEIVHYGINYRGQPDEQTYDWPVYSIQAVDPHDQLGVGLLEGAIRRHQPDVFWAVQDLWHLALYMEVKPALELPAVTYFPVDTPNLKWSYALAMGAMSEVATYTEFGAREAAAGVQQLIDMMVNNPGAKEDAEYMGSPRRWVSVPNPGSGRKLNARFDRLARFQNEAGYTVIPHGLEEGVFEVRDKREARKRFELPEDAFIVGNVNTNQFRKRQDLSIRAFMMLAQQAPNALLVMHCAGPQEQGWDLANLAQYYGVENQIRLIHGNADHPEWASLDQDQLVDLYNCFDVQINTGGGEGWGLTSVEGAACGVPQMVPDWSATREIWKNSGVLLPVSDYRVEPRLMNSCHAIVDPVATGDALVDIYKDEAMRERFRTAALELAHEQLTWTEVGARFEALIMKALDEPVPANLSFNDLLDLRELDVKSELYRAVALDRGRPLVVA